MSLNRRQFLTWAGTAPIASQLLLSTPTVLASPSLSQPKPEGRRHLNLRSLHTGETAKVTYWEQGEYSIDALADIFLLMRDHRQNSVAPIDIKLLDQLFSIQEKLGSTKEIMMVSGYRSPETNAQLREAGVGVAKRSLHMKGRAMDFRIPGLNLRQVHKATLASTIGGVGYYGRSGYIHMDTGRKRRWHL